MCRRRTEAHPRNLAGFWFLGLCNNFSYVIMLSAAHDILKDERHDHTNSSQIQNATTNNASSSYLECNQIGTAAILLADILPALLMKLAVPFYIHLFPYYSKVIVVMAFSSASYMIVGLAESVPLSIVGVVCASIGSGLGEPVFLALTSHFHRDVISAWSSGTGGAGIFGALTYAGLTQIGVKPRTAVLMMLVITGVMGLRGGLRTTIVTAQQGCALIAGCSYFLLLKRPRKHPHLINADHDERDERDVTDEASLILQEDPKPVFSRKEKVAMLPGLMKYMVPLMGVYFAEYFINQGLTEMLYFNNIWLSTPAQYRWYNVDYQLGVFISRSSVNVFHIRNIWILPILQFANLAVLLTQVFLRFIPNFWIIIILVLFEGLIGGGAYVNTFYRLYRDMPEERREYSMTVVSIADALGICLSGAVAVPVHNVICDMKIKM